MIKYKVEILSFTPSSSGRVVQTAINSFIKDKEVINVTTALAAGGILSAGGIVVTILYTVNKRLTKTI